MKKTVYGKELSVQKIRNIQIDILDSVDEFCKNNGIKYYLFAGSLLGAIRHNGYIPWDDDIDIAMLRKDYEKFSKKYKNDRFVAYCYSNNKSYEHPFMKVCDTQTILVEDSLNMKRAKYGVNIDVYPLDNLTDDYHDGLRLMNKIKPYGMIINIKNIVRAKKRNILKKIIIDILKIILLPVSHSWCFKKIDRISKTYIDNDDSKFLGQIAHFSGKGKKEITERAWFGEGKYVRFEDRMYMAPCNPEKVLRRLYGDYMRMPPEEQQVSLHTFKVYKK